jgi:hypothetical protein
MSNRQHVLIAVPTLEGRVSSAIAQLFTVAERKNWQDGKYKFTTTSVEGVRGYALARNNVAQLYLTGPFGRLWMIDDDIIPDMDVFELLDVDADIVAPLMPILQRHKEYTAESTEMRFSLESAAFTFGDFADINTRSSPDFERGQGLRDVDGVGFGCTVFSDRVLRDLRLRGPREFMRADGITYRLPDDAPPPVFREWRAPNGALEFGEDADFCYRAKKLGYTIRLHTEIEVDHKKNVGLRDMMYIKRHYRDVALRSQEAIK